jgi:hypothetical protein
MGLVGGNMTHLGTRTDISNVATKMSNSDLVPGAIPLNARAPRTAEKNIGTMPMAGKGSYSSRPQDSKSEKAKGKTRIVSARSWW